VRMSVVEQHDRQHNITCNEYTNIKKSKNQNIMLVVQKCISQTDTNVSGPWSCTVSDNVIFIGLVVVLL